MLDINLKGFSKPDNLLSLDLIREAVKSFVACVQTDKHAAYFFEAACGYSYTRIDWARRNPLMDTLYKCAVAGINTRALADVCRASANSDQMEIIGAITATTPEDKIYYLFIQTLKGVIDHVTEYREFYSYLNELINDCLKAKNERNVKIRENT